MDYQSLNQKTVVELRNLAKEMGVRIPAGTNKSTLISMLLEADKAKPAPTARDGEAQKPKKDGGRGRKPAQANKGVEKPAQEAAKPNKGAEKPAREAAKEEKPEKPAREEKPEKPAQRRDGTRDRKPAPDARSAGTGGEAPSSEAAAPAQKPAPQAQDNPAAAEAPEGKPAAGTAIPPRANPRPAGEGQPRQGRFQNWGGGRTSQGEARPQRVQQSGAGSAPRPMNARYGRPGEGRAPAQAWENRENPRRAAQPAAVQPESAQAAAQPERQRPEGFYNAELKTSNPAVPEMLASGECGDGAGVLELQPDGYGFLRAENCLPGPNDVYISIAQIRRFNLRSGDHVVGKTRPQREGDRYSAMMYITEVNGESPEKAAERPRFEDLVPIYPDQRLRLEPPEGKADLSLRLIDMLAPIGKGQRGMIVSQPKAGKTTLLKKVANAITAQYPDVHLIVLLIDERPEEVTDMQRSIRGEVIYSTFDEEPEHHTRVSEMVLARAQRLVEMGRDVVVLLDSITRLARAYNLTITPTGRSLSGGLDPGALFKPKRFFGAARNIENGGSLTIIATALVETGSRMDDIIFEEFKGTGNMELHLDRKLSDRRVFPAIDLLKSGTRREELLLSEDEMNGEYQVRKMLSGRQQEMYEQLIDLMTKTASNAEFFYKLKGWLAVYEKEGYSLGK